MSVMHGRRGQRPIAVFQHTEVGAPGAVVPVLRALGREVVVIRIVDGEPVPPDPSVYGALVFMGGYMSAHDPVPWIAQELTLMRMADKAGVPMAGHCLGSQLLALALGGEVRPNNRPEIGWCEIDSASLGEAQAWWGPNAGRRLRTFQWHGDAFTPPSGSVRIASGEHCANQVVIVHDRHLLVQSHLEMTPELVELSLRRNGYQLARQNTLSNPACSPLKEVGLDLRSRTDAMHVLLRQLYTRWAEAWV